MQQDKELQAANRELSTQNQILKQQIKELQEALDSERLFTASMNHELRTPLNSILGSMHYLLTDKTLTDKQHQTVDLALCAGNTMLQIVNDLLDCYKIEAGQFEIIEEPFHLKDIIRQVEGMFSYQMMEKNLDFTINISPDTVCGLKSDATRLLQIMTNLVSNAVKYTNTGGVTLSVEVRHNHLYFDVTDSGEGITKEARDELFVPFKRINSGQHKHIQGTGLGLSIVASLLQQMHGQISVQSEPGKGSTFSVTLPVEITDSSITYGGDSEHTAFDPGHIDFHGAHILCVDDTPANLHTFYHLLENTNLTIDLVKSGVQALCITKKRKYQLIFVEHALQDMDGAKTLQSLRKTAGENQNTPVIAMSAASGKHAVTSYQSMGFDNHLSKPIIREELLQMIHDYIK